MESIWIKTPLAIYTGSLADAEGGIDLQVEAAEKLGVRAIFTRGYMSLGEDEGGLAQQTHLARSWYLLQSRRDQALG